MSLNDICNDLDDKFECRITKQSMHERFNKNAVKFLKSVISRSIENKIEFPIKHSLTENFNAIKIQDSTSFQVHESFAEYYGGAAGITTGGLARIQFEYDLKSMNMTTLELVPGKYQDSTYSQDKLDQIKEKELIIRDLGYVSNKYLQAIINKKAFFLNRLNTKQNVYTKKVDGRYNLVDFHDLEAKMNKNNIQSCEKDIYLKIEREYVGMRLIIERVPDEVYAKRIRKSEKEAKKRGWKISKEFRVRKKFNLFITNVSKSILSTRYISYLYSVRWQIELMFKSWKSTFGIEKTKPIKRYRYECLLYAKLLLIIVSWRIYSRINNAIIYYNKLKTLVITSYQKFSLLVKQRLDTFIQSIAYRGGLLNRFISSLIRTTFNSCQYIEPKAKTFSCIHVFELICYHIDNMAYMKST